MLLLAQAACYRWRRLWWSTQGFCCLWSLIPLEESHQWRWWVYPLEYSSKHGLRRTVTQWCIYCVWKSLLILHNMQMFTVMFIILVILNCDDKYHLYFVLHYLKLFYVKLDYVNSLLQASHYIGLGCNVVLCVQMITEESVINGEQVSWSLWL